MCEFKEGVPLYYTTVKTVATVGCPDEILVQYLDPYTKKIQDWVATRRGVSIETCGAGVTAVRVKPTAARNSPPKATATPVKVKRWNAVAGGIWHVNGVPQVSVGYSGARASAEEARASALQACRSGGAQNCKPTQAFNSGCFYITTGRNSSSAGWYSAATAAGATSACYRSGKTTCKQPIGGCVN